MNTRWQVYLMPDRNIKWLNTLFGSDYRPDYLTAVSKNVFSATTLYIRLLKFPVEIGLSATNSGQVQKQTEMASQTHLPGMC
jgi:hypothetical protein